MDDEPAQPTFVSTPSVNRRQFLGKICGALAAIGAIPALSGIVTAHFPLKLEIDVQPENALNFIDVDEHETVTVGVHRTEFLNSDGEVEMFDPTNEPVRYRFGSWGVLDDGDGAHPAGDGEVATFDSGTGNSEENRALLVTFPVSETGLEGGEEAVWLYWERDESGGHGYAGIDKVSVYGEV